jgi:hypothetical protein
MSWNDIYSKRLRVYLDNLFAHQINLSKLSKSNVKAKRTLTTTFLKSRKKFLIITLRTIFTNICIRWFWKQLVFLSCLKIHISKIKFLFHNRMVLLNRACLKRVWIPAWCFWVFFGLQSQQFFSWWGRQASEDPVRPVRRFKWRPQ